MRRGRVAIRQVAQLKQGLHGAPNHLHQPGQAALASLSRRGLRRPYKIINQ